MAEHSPVVSVIVPVYNTEGHLAACVDSILAQTQGDIEVLLIDDGSTDGSGDICRDFASQDARVQVVVQENAGVSSARNTGLELARGEFVHFVDSDDWLEPTLYEDVLTEMRKADADMAIFEYFVDMHDRSVRHAEKASAYGLLNPTAALEVTIASQNSFVFTRLFTRSRIGGATYRTDLHWGEETLFVCEVTEQGSRIVHLPGAYYHYRQSAGSATRSGFGPRRLSGLETARALLTMTTSRHPELVPHALAFKGGILTQLITETWPDAAARQEHSSRLRLDLAAVLLRAMPSSKVSPKTKARWLLASVSPTLLLRGRKVSERRRRAA